MISVMGEDISLISRNELLLFVLIQKGLDAFEILNVPIFVPNQLE